jgi:hypothetical protein
MEKFLIFTTQEKKRAVIFLSIWLKSLQTFCRQNLKSVWIVKQKNKVEEMNATKEKKEKVIQPTPNSSPLTTRIYMR